MSAIDDRPGQLLITTGRVGTRMKLLRHLLIDPKTTYLVGDGQAHFRHTFNGGCHQVYLTCFARTEIHFNGLPCPCFVFHGNFDPDGVCQFHLVLFGLQAEGELVKAELQYFRKSPNTFRAVASKTKIEILSGAAARAKRSSIATPPFR